MRKIAISKIYNEEGFLDFVVGKLKKALGTLKTDAIFRTVCLQTEINPDSFIDELKRDIIVTSDAISDYIEVDKNKAWNGHTMEFWVNKLAYGALGVVRFPDLDILFEAVELNVSDFYDEYSEESEGEE